MHQEHVSRAQFDLITSVGPRCADMPFLSALLLLGPSLLLCAFRVSPGMFHLSPSAWAAVTKSHRLGGSNNRNVLSPSSGGRKSKIKASQGWFLLGAVRAGSVPGLFPWLVDGHLLPVPFFFFKVSFKKKNFIFLFLAVLGLRFCARAFSSCGKRGPLFIVVRGPLTIVAPPVAGHRLQSRKLSSCGSRA